MLTSTDCTIRADECRRLAKLAAKPEDWGHFLEMAETWEMLAKQRKASEQVADEQVAVADEQVAAQEVANEQMADQQLADEQLAAQQMADEHVADEEIDNEELADEQLAAILTLADGIPRPANERRRPPAC